VVKNSSAVRLSKSRRAEPAMKITTSSIDSETKAASNCTIT